MSKLVDARVKPDRAAIEAARLGSDALRERRPPFGGAGHAAAWYFATERKLSAAKTSLGVATERLELGVQVDGGRGSVLEGEFCLVADVGACLPRPRGEPDGREESWRSWVMFVACLRDGHDIAGGAGKVRDLFDTECDWADARKLLRSAVSGFLEELRRRRLVR